MTSKTLLGPESRSLRNATKIHGDSGGIVSNIAVTRNLEPTALFIGLSAGNGGGRQPGRIVQTRKRSEAEQARKVDAGASGGV